MKFLTSIMMILLLACGASEETTSANSDAANNGGKADDTSDVQQNDGNTTDGENTDGGSLADSFDYCGEFELYGDGECHRFCFEPDPDCEGVPEEEDFCAEYRESDGECSIPCGDVDPDCEVEPQDSDWEEDEQILSICAGLEVGDRIEEFAESLCVGWMDNPTAFPQCIEACIAANRAN